MLLKAAATLGSLRAANESLFSAEVEVELCSLHQSSPDNAATGGLSARGENQSWGATWSKQLGKEMQGGGGRERERCKHCSFPPFLPMAIGQQRAVAREVTGALSMGKHHLEGFATCGASKCASSI